MILTLLHQPFVHGLLTGLGTAALVDIGAFLKWKDETDIKAFNYRLAMLRWAQGAVSGAIFGAGLGAYL